MDLVLAPKNSGELLQIRLPRPKDGRLQRFLYDEQNLVLYEITKFQDQHRSWFLDNLFCKHGHLNLVTRMDPLFIFIPVLAEHASNQFRNLHDVCSSFASQNIGSDRLDYALAPGINWDNICDVKLLDDEQFMRYNEAKTVKWLLRKHGQTMTVLKDQLGPQTSKESLISFASDLIGLYLSPDLANKLKIQMWLE